MTKFTLKSQQVSKETTPVPEVTLEEAIRTCNTRAIARLSCHEADVPTGFYIAPLT
jgi:hypothetical protein